MGVILVSSASEAAAKWWASALYWPRLDNGLLANPGMRSRIHELKLMNAKYPQSLEALSKFEAELQRVVARTLEAKGRAVLYVEDAKPCDVLQDIASNSGIMSDYGRWPFATNMWAAKDEVLVSYGFRAPWEIIWRNKD